MEGAMGEYPVINMRLDPDHIGEQAKVLLKEVIPGLDTADIRVKPLGGGMANHLVRCQNSQSPSEPGWVVRIYGEGVSKLMLPRDRDHERSVQGLLSKLDMAPRIRCFFDNGICYDFFEGKCYSWTDCQEHKEDHMIDSISMEMARWHSSKTLVASRGVRLDQTVTPIVHMRKLLRSWPEGFDEKEKDEVFKTSFPSYQELVNEVDRLEEVLGSFNMPLVLGHNDLSMTNLLYQEDKGRMIFLDYEWAGMTYAAWDIGIHLAYCSVGLDGDPANKLATRDVIEKWVTRYLGHLGRLEGLLEGRPPSSKDIDTLVSHVETVLPITQFFLSLVITVLFTNLKVSDEYQNADYMSVAATKINFYQKTKETSLKGRRE